MNSYRYWYRFDIKSKICIGIVIGLIWLSIGIGVCIIADISVRYRLMTISVSVLVWPYRSNPICSIDVVFRGGRLQLKKNYDYFKLY